jgi:CheY-like chemotaxis protein
VQPETRARRPASQDRRALPLVAITGWADIEERERAEAAGVDYVLVTPVTADTLRTLPSSRHGGPALKQFSRSFERTP